MSRVKLNRGFSLLETLTAIAIVGLLSAVIFKLQWLSLNNTKDIIIRQKSITAANSLINQIVVHSKNSNDIDGVIRHYVENNYSAPINQFKSCSISLCNDKEFASWLLNNWKNDIVEVNNLTENSIKAIICHDNSMIAPTIEAPNCDNNPNSHVVLKIVWINSIDEVIVKKLKQNDNYVMLRVHF